MAFGVPSLVEMTKIVKESLPTSSPEANQFDMVSNELASQGFSTDIENVLSALEALMDPGRIREEIGPKVAALSGGKPLDVICNISELTSRIKQKIKELCTDADFEKAKQFYQMLFEACGASVRKQGGIPGIDLFQTTFVTTNYDVTIEESFDILGIGYSDGFVWDDIRKQLVFAAAWGAGRHLLKMHGSVDYHQNEQGLVVKDRAKEKIGRPRKMQDILVYPAGEKSITTYPYYELYYRFYEELKNQSRVLTLGFSFRDYAIRNLFVDWLRRRRDARLINYSRSARKQHQLFPSDVSDRVISRDKNFVTEDWRPGFTSDLIG